MKERLRSLCWSICFMALSVLAAVTGVGVKGFFLVFALAITGIVSAIRAIKR